MSNLIKIRNELMIISQLYDCYETIDEYLNKTKRVRRFRFDPSNKQMRDDYGIYGTFITKLEQHPERFYNFFHIDENIFELILSEISPCLIKQSSQAFPTKLRVY